MPAAINGMQQVRGGGIEPRRVGVSLRTLLVCFTPSQIVLDGGSCCILTFIRHTQYMPAHHRSVTTRAAMVCGRTTRTRHRLLHWGREQ